MKRSEMIEHIQGELIEIAKNRHYSNEYYTDYYLRKAQAMLDMLEGFGMLPPTKDGKITVETTEDGSMFLPIWGWDEETETEQPAEPAEPGEYELTIEYEFTITDMANKGRRPVIEEAWDIIKDEMGSTDDIQLSYDCFEGFPRVYKFKAVRKKP